MARYSMALVIATLLALGFAAREPKLPPAKEPPGEKPAKPQPKAVPPNPKVPTPEEYLEQTKPGAEHATLAKYVGSWDVAATSGADPDAKKYTGQSVHKLAVGKRYLQIEFETRGGAGPLTLTDGLFTIGFDRRHRVYTISAMNSFGTYPLHSVGKADAKTGIVTMLGTDDDPILQATGFGGEFVHRLTFRSDDELRIEYLFIDSRTEDRKEIKALDFVFKRRK